MSATNPVHHGFARRPTRSSFEVGFRPFQREVLEVQSPLPVRPRCAARYSFRRILLFRGQRNRNPTESSGMFCNRYFAFCTPEYYFAILKVSSLFSFCSSLLRAAYINLYFLVSQGRFRSR